MQNKTDNRIALTIAEMLIVLAITAILLAAVAVAFNASVISYRENENAFKAISSARQALFRITTQLRTAVAVDPSAASNECSLKTAEGDFITYRYNNADNKLYLVTNDNPFDRDYVLCDNVTAMTFTKTLTDDRADVKSVQILMTVRSGNSQKTLPAAAVVRKNLR
jgi:Tfp pilus assembly protein FimT